MIRQACLLALVAVVLANPKTTKVKKLTQAIEDYILKSKNYVEDKEKFYYEKYHKVTDRTKYDFIIVGGGSAGSVLAHYLSARKHWKVLLLEAGGEECEVTKVPGLKNYVAKSEANWNFTTAPNDCSCLGFQNNQCTIRRGRILGGTSSIDEMFAQTGHPADYHLWSLDNPEWCWENVHPVFLDLINYQLKHEDHPRKCYRQEGPTWVENPRWKCLDTNAFIQASQEIGLELTTTGCSNLNGIGFIRALTKKGERQSTATTFLYPIRHRQNLHVSTNSYVVKILIDRHESCAEGVQYVKGNKLITAFARKEVLITAGSINSPKLLMLSGIGPKEELKHHGIKVVADLPVGQNIRTSVVYFGDKYLFKDCLECKTATLKEQVAQYLSEGKGPLVKINGGSDLIAYLVLRDLKKQEVTPDLELVPTPNLNWFNNDEDRLKPEVYEKIACPLLDKTGFGLELYAPHTKSCGNITLKNCDPFAKPIVNTNLLDDSRDVETILQGIRIGQQLVDTKILKHLQGGVRQYLPQIPACPDLLPGCDDYFRCAIRHFTAPTAIRGSVRMGTPTDRRSVVDEKLRVYNVRSLRVVGSAVVPVTIVGDTTLQTQMIAQRAAWFILKKY